MWLILLVINSSFCQEYRNLQGKWEEIIPTTATNLACSACTSAFLAPSSGAIRELILTIPTLKGYSDLAYDFDLHLISTSPSAFVTIQENGITIIQQQMNFYTPNNICGMQNYFLNIKFSTTKIIHYSTITLSISIPATQFFIKNFKSLAYRCGRWCQECDTNQRCVQCIPNFSLDLRTIAECKCLGPTPIEYLGTCISQCPLGYYFKENSCVQYTSKANIFSDYLGNQYTIIPDYNTTLRSQQIQINGINVSPIIQNEKLRYPIYFQSGTSVDIEISMTLYLLNFNQLQNIYMQLNEYAVFQVFHVTTEINLITYGSISASTCSVSGYNSCQKLEITFVLSQITSISSITIFASLYLHKLNQAWGLGSLSLNSIVQAPIVNSCLNNIYRGECVTNCPPYSTLVGNECQDFSDIYKYPQYIIKSLYGSLFSGEEYYYVPQYYPIQFYKQRYIYGGYGKWNYGFQDFPIGPIIVKPHFKIKLHIKMLLIDFSFDQEAMTIIFEGSVTSIHRNQAVCQTITPCLQDQEQIGQAATDCVYSFEKEMDHQDSSVKLSFVCQTLVSTSYCALYDYFLFIAACPENCLLCTSDTNCIEQISDLDVWYDCPSGYYLNNERICTFCGRGCKVCTANACLQCEDEYEFFGNQCYCTNNKYLGAFKISCNSLCHPTCQECVAIWSTTVSQIDLSQMKLCITCNSAEKKVLNAHICICQDGYYMDESYICQQCYPACKHCSSARVCTDCDSLQNRILEDYLCICMLGYFETDGQMQCIKCNSTCKDCEYLADFCTHCFPAQYRELLQNQCVCQQGYYENNSDQCQKCSDFCENCSDFLICTSCNDFQFRSLTAINQCSCMEGYYDIGELMCKPCYYTCSQCNNSDQFNQCTKCPNSRQRFPASLDSFQCHCKKGYFDNGLRDCISCKTFINPPTSHYCYSSCGDEIVQWDEECDDGNLEPRDGCDQCFFDNSLCLSEICSLCTLGYCMECIQGYYLNADYQCIECSSICLTCKDSSDNCIKCKYQINSICLSCSTENGYIEYQGQCLSVCGDGVKTILEECDDGNSINGDGCDQTCRVEEGYICQQACQKIRYVQMILTETQSDSIYSGLKNVELTFSESVKLNTNSPLLSIFTVKPVQDDLTFHSLNISDLTNYSEQYNNITINIQLYLDNSYQNPQLMAIIQNFTLIMNTQNISMQSGNSTVTLIDYYEQSGSVIAGTQNVMSFSQIILFIFLSLAILALILGGLDIFWNLLDTLQLLSYLKYFNVIYPYNLSSYFSLFGFAEFDFLKQYFDLDTFISQFVETPNAPPKFFQEGYSTVFIVNIISVIIVFLTTIGTFIAFHLLFYISGKLTKEFCEEQIYEKQKLNVITILFFKLTRNLQNCFYSLKIQFKCALLRSFMTVSYDLNLAIFLQLCNFSQSHQVLFFSGLCATAALFFYCLAIYIGFIIMSNQRYYFTLREVELQYGALYEGLRLKESRFSYYYNLFLMIKKGLYMAFLVILYNQPCFQIAFASFLSLILSLYLFVVRPLENDTEYYKQLISEAILWIVQCLIFIYAYSEMSMNMSYSFTSNIGWVIIGLLTLLILIQLFLDIKQHFYYLSEKYQFIQFIIEKVRLLRKRLLQGDDQEDRTNSESLEELTYSSSKLKKSSPIIQKEQSQFSLKVRKLVTFSLPNVQEGIK